MTQVPEGLPAAAAHNRLMNVLRNDVGHELFTANCLLDVVADLDRAAQMMASEGRMTPDDIEEAEDALRVVLRGMVDVRADFGYSEFREDTWFEAKRRFCPRWPIC